MSAGDEEIAGLDLLDEPDDLFFAGSALFRVRHSSGLTDLRNLDWRGYGGARQNRRRSADAKASEKADLETNAEIPPSSVRVFAPSGVARS